MPALLASVALILAGVWAVFALARRPDPPGGATPGAEAAARHVVLVTLDGLRADHASAYGYPRPTTPNLERLSRQAVTFTAAYAAAPSTLASQASLHTGARTRTHMTRYAKDAIDDAFVTLAERLVNAGFATAGFTDGRDLGRQHGFAAGFQRYEDDLRDGWMRNNGLRRRLPAALDWLRRHDGGRAFLFLQSYDCLPPFVVEDAAREALAATPPAAPATERFGLSQPMDYLRRFPIHEPLKLEGDSSLERLVDAYDATIRFADERVGALLDALESADLLDQTLLVVTSSHGLSLLDHGLYAGHGLSPFDEEVRVPLLIRFPGGAHGGKRVDVAVGLIDVYPTICAALGLDVPPTIDGADVTPAILGDENFAERVVTGESPNLAAKGVEGVLGQTGYARQGRWKFVEAPRIDAATFVSSHLLRAEEGEPYDLATDPFGIAGRWPREARLFDVERDPGETVDLAAAESGVVEALRSALAEAEAASILKWTRLVDRSSSPAAAGDEAELERLFAAGYLSAAEYERRRKEVQRRAMQERLEAEARGEGGGS